MNDRHDGSSIDLERALVRVMVERRISRRQLLEAMARVGPVVALAPILAACTGSAASASPSAASSSSPGPTPEAELNVYNWDGYIDKEIVGLFEEKYGVKVTYDNFPDGGTMETKIESDGKGAGYDITYPASVVIPRLVANGVIQPLRPDLIPNMANLGAEWTNPGYDPGNATSAPYMWWSTGYSWDGDKIPDKLDSWEVLWDPAYSGKISMLDDNREVFAVAAFRLGLDPNTTNEADLDRMVALLDEQKPLIRTYTNSMVGALIGGEVTIAHCWSGAVAQMVADIPNIRYVIPKEGAVRGSDTMVILSGAPHPIAANLWINFNLDAQVSAKNTNAIGYMGPNAAAKEFIDPAILGDPMVNPDIAVLETLTELLELGADMDKYTQRWNALKV